MEGQEEGLREGVMSRRRGFLWRLVMVLKREMNKCFDVSVAQARKKWLFFKREETEFDDGLSVDVRLSRPGFRRLSSSEECEEKRCESV